jgi:hypothetical protein
MSRARMMRGAATLREPPKGARRIKRAETRRSSFCDNGMKSTRTNAMLLTHASTAGEDQRMISDAAGRREHGERAGA